VGLVPIGNRAAESDRPDASGGVGTEIGSATSRRSGLGRKKKESIEEEDQWE